MSDKMMKDVFGTSLYNDPASRLSNSMLLIGPEKEAAIQAISEHDILTNRVKVQKEALETALTSMLDSGYSHNSVVIKLIKQALEADNG